MTVGRVRRSATLVFAGALTLVLGACGGGGGGSSTPPTGPAAAPTAGAQAGSGTLSFAITIPSGSNAAANSRAPKYVSPSTASVTVTLAGQTTPLGTVNTAAGAPGCTASANGTTCTVTVTAPAGNQTFNVATYSGPNGTGNQLSVARVPASISTNSTTTVPLALQGVVASVTAILGSTSVPVGAPAAVAVTIVAYDNSNNIIVGAGNFSSPVTVTDVDPSGNTSLTSTTPGVGQTQTDVATVSVPAPGTSVTLNYNGNSVTAATITPSIGSSSGTAATFAPAGDVAVNFTTPPQTGVFSAMAAGPDGNVWFAAINDCCTYPANIDKVAPNGSVTVYNTNTPYSYIYGLAPSSDKSSLWFGDDNGDVGRIDTSGNVSYASSANTPCESENTVCGEVDYMVLGPDGNDWFSDCGYGYIGYVTPQGAIVEFDPTQLPGWQGEYSSPEQIAFGSDGNLYVADEDGYVDQITITNDVPSSIVVLPNPAGCEVYSLAIGPDGNPWFGDDCANIGTVPLSSFNAGSLLEWSIAGIDNGNPIDFLIGSPGGLWATDDSDGAVYQISNLSGVSAAQPPSVTPVTVFAYGGADSYVENLGPDNNLWVASDNESLVQPSFAKLIYGAPASGALSLKRIAAASVRASTTISRVKHKHSRRGRGRGPGAHTEMHGHPHRPKPV